MSTKRSFLRLPSELRLHIYRDYFQLDGGYAYDAKSDKLKTSDDQPIDLALILTCRTIAEETRQLPLSLNVVTFSTLYREDWQSLAGCFNVVTTFYRHLEADLVLHLAEFMTPEMYEQLALKYPDFASQLEAVSRDHRRRYLDDNNYNLNKVMAAESGAKRARVQQWKGRRCCVVVQDVLADVNWALKWPDRGYSGFSRLHRSRNNWGHPSKTWFGSDSEVQHALSHCLRLIADKKPVQFANHLRATFPQWTEPDIVQNFLRLRFENWAIPSESQVKNAIRLLDIDGIWDFPDRWHYEPASVKFKELEQYLDDEFDNSDDDQDNDLDDDQNDDQDDDRDNEQDDESDINGPVANFQYPSGLRWREKIRFSAAANAIRFLRRIPGQRIGLKQIVLHEDFDSVNDPHTHARGLAPFVKENPSLQIVHRVSLLDCIIGVSGPPCALARSLQRGKAIKLESMDFIPRLSRNIGYWIRDALVVKDVGIPVKSFTLLLEAGVHQDFCTDLLQRVVHRDVAWHRAYKLLDAHGTFPHDDLSRHSIPKCMMRDEDVTAIDELVNRTSGVLSADFNTGVALDAQALAQQTEHLHGFEWFAEWQLFDGSRRQEIPPGLVYDKLADVIEFRTDDGQPVTNPQAT
ncbi:hypothetical protein H9Q72_013368 [Fusarium xylarioides]|uniref:Uncharacterized protein n=1 Tax=Fusarium xylarioides TaxID=221167 RepID=A0A9P7KYU0_9HYPO|nr:hypothetical protein H9Q72_013368 [Fusarium xylarioides]